MLRLWTVAGLWWPAPKSSCADLCAFDFVFRSGNKKQSHYIFCGFRKQKIEAMDSGWISWKKKRPRILREFREQKRPRILREFCADYVRTFFYHKIHTTNAYPVFADNSREIRDQISTGIREKFATKSATQFARNSRHKSRVREPASSRASELASSRARELASSRARELAIS